MSSTAPKDTAQILAENTGVSSAAEDIGAIQEGTEFTISAAGLAAAIKRAAWEKEAAKTQRGRNKLSVAGWLRSLRRAGRLDWATTERLLA